MEGGYWAKLTGMARIYWENGQTIVPAFQADEAAILLNKLKTCLNVSVHSVCLFQRTIHLTTSIGKDTTADPYISADSILFGMPTL